MGPLQFLGPSKVAHEYRMYPSACVSQESERMGFEHFFFFFLEIDWFGFESLHAG